MGIGRGGRLAPNAQPPPGQLIPERLTKEVLTFVADAGIHCQIFRDTAGGYVVEHPHGTERFRRVATLPCAYSLCLELELLEDGPLAHSG